MKRFKHSQFSLYVCNREWSWGIIIGRIPKTIEYYGYRLSIDGD